MILSDDNEVKMSGKLEELMTEYMDITEAIYHKVLKADKDQDMEKLFKDSIAFSILSEEEKEKELLKLKNKNALLENFIKFMGEGEEDYD
jgi:hypothetical protein